MNQNNLISFKRGDFILSKDHNFILIAIGLIENNVFVATSVENNEGFSGAPFHTYTKDKYENLTENNLYYKYLSEITNFTDYILFKIKQYNL